MKTSLSISSISRLLFPLLWDDSGEDDGDDEEEDEVFVASPSSSSDGMSA